MLKTNPQFELAQRQMKQGGGLLSVELNASGIEEVEAFCDSLKYFVLATSWGGHESLCLPMCALKQSASLSNGLGWNFIRLYIGLEDPELLLEDLKASLDCVR
jgi:cystathionine beta-lyase/cystathionine gamma-synthase